MKNPGTKTGKKHKFTMGMAVLYFLLTALVFICLYPFLNVLAYSLSGYNAVFSGDVTFYPIEFTLDAYKQILGRAQIWIAMRVTIFVTLMGTAIGLVLTIFAVYALSRKNLPGKKLLSGLILFTMYFSGGMVPAYILVNKLGMINTRWSMIIPMAMSTYNMIICRTYIVNSIPDELYEASQMDGCTPFRYMLSVVVPLSKPILAVLTLYYGVVRWNDYFNAMLYLYKDNLQPLTIVMKEILIMSQVDMTQVTDASAVSKLQGMSELLKYSTIVVASLPVMLLYPLIQKHLVKGVMIGAVKG